MTEGRLGYSCDFGPPPKPIPLVQVDGDDFDKFFTTNYPGQWAVEAYGSTPAYREPIHFVHAERWKGDAGPSRRIGVVLYAGGKPHIWLIKKAVFDMAVNPADYPSAKPYKPAPPRVEPGSRHGISTLDKE